MRSIDFYLGLGSRYSYLAASQVDRIEKIHGCRFVWKPIASGALMDRRGGNPFRGDPLSGQYDWGYREYDAKCWADHYGIPFREPVAFRTDPAMLALACLAADGQGALVRCWRGGWVSMRKPSSTNCRQPRPASGTTASWTRPRPAVRSAFRPSFLATGCSGATIAWCCSRRH
jgi:hypothetical protein